jgi:hypothetical protein
MHTPTAYGCAVPSALPPWIACDVDAVGTDSPGDECDGDCEQPTTMTTKENAAPAPK